MRTSGSDASVSGSPRFRGEHPLDFWSGPSGPSPPGRLCPLETARYTLTTEIWDPVSGRLRRTRPRYVVTAPTEAGQLARIERWEGNDFIAHGTDDNTIWATMNGEPLVSRDMDYDQVPYVTASSASLSGRA